MSQELMPRPPIQIIEHQSPTIHEGTGEGGDFIGQLSEYAQGGNEVTMTLKMRSKKRTTLGGILLFMGNCFLGGVLFAAFVYFLMTASW